MRIALLQGPTGSGDVAGNLVMLERVAVEVAAAGARLLVAPEMFLTGYDIGAEAVARLAEPADGPSAQAVSRIAARAGVGVAYGFPERAGGRVFNAVSLVGPDGDVVTTYRKTHLYGEVDSLAFSPGDGGFTTVTFEGVTLGLLVCYDVEFPETVRSLALAGAELVVVPTALMVPYDVVAQVVVPARAFENQVYLAYANRTGRETQLEYCGRSCVVGPDGADLARAGSGEEVLLADLDLEHLRASRSTGGHLTDRRPELYGSLVEGAR